MITKTIWPLAVTLALGWALLGCGNDAESGSSICGNNVIEPGEQCEDRNIDDGDGCSSTCQNEENCADSVDNDGDGKVDCADSECMDNPICPDENCGDGQDNDSDGAIDCMDDDCVEEPGCGPPYCEHGDRIVTLTTGMETVTGDTSAAGAYDYDEGSCQRQLGGGEGSDLVYKITPPGNILSLTLASTTDHGLYVRTSCANENAEIACADFEFGGSDERLETLVDTNADVYVFVGAFRAGDEGPFTLTVDRHTAICGDGIVEGIEGCDDGNTEPGDMCPSDCDPQKRCGDNDVFTPIHGGSEECDDGNSVSDDGCSSECLIEGKVLEQEPNHAGEPMLFTADEFTSSPQGDVITADQVVEATIDPAGDEDVFVIENTQANQVTVRLQMFHSDTGFGRPCTAAHMFMLLYVGSKGMPMPVYATEANLCPSFEFTALQPDETLYVHIMDYGDNDRIDTYWLSVEFL